MNISRLLTILVVTSMSVPALAQTPSGLEIMKERQRRHDAKSETNKSLMKLFDRKGRVKERMISVMSKKGEDGLSKTLLQFLSPADIRNVGLLTWEQGENEEDNQWLYLPASRRVKRIAGGNKKSQFMGTDLAYEDLRPENLNTHTYEVIGEETVDGNSCWVVEAIPSTPKEKKDTGYGKRHFWVRKDIYFIIRAEFYAHSGKRIKIATFDELQHVRDQMWRANWSSFERILFKTKTITTTLSRELDAELPESLFTQQGLTRPPSAK
jgi:hypothetical protein